MLCWEPELSTQDYAFFRFHLKATNQRATVHTENKDIEVTADYMCWMNMVVLWRWLCYQYGKIGWCQEASLLLVLCVNHLKYTHQFNCTWWFYLIYGVSSFPLKWFPGSVAVLDTRFVVETAWAFKLLRTTLKRVKWPWIMCFDSLCFMHVTETLMQRSVGY